MGLASLDYELKILWSQRFFKVRDYTLLFEKKFGLALTPGALSAQTHFNLICHLSFIWGLILVLVSRHVRKNSFLILFRVKVKIRRLKMSL